MIEAEYTLALMKAERAFVSELIRRITEEGWGPVELWRELQAACARRHEPQDTTVEAAM